MVKAAGEEAEGAGQGVLSEAPRQLEDLLSGGLPGLPLDAPTIMSLVIIVAFVLQFYWTLITLSLTDASSSSLSVTPTTTTTTTAVPSPVVTLQVIRRQTVTPAPPPEWRHLPDFKLPQWVVKRSADVLERSGVKYVQQLNSVAGQETPHKVGVVDEVWHARPRMSLRYRSDGRRDVWRVQEPLPTSSHRLVELSHQDEEVRDTGMAAKMLYAAERWGDHLQHWKILSPDGAQLLTQTLLMVRCAVVSVDFCAKLDHYFRRQHDLNLAAEMMNYHDDDSQKYDDDYNYNQWLLELNETSSAANQGPRYVQELQTTTMTEEDKDGAQQRYGQEQEGDRKVWASGSVGNKTWNIYVFMSVMAVLVFLMDASYRILRVVSTSGRAVNDPHQHLLATLSAAMHRWDTQQLH